MIESQISTQEKIKILEGKRLFIAESSSFIRSLKPLSRQYKFEILTTDVSSNPGWEEDLTTFMNNHSADAALVHNFAQGSLIHSLDVIKDAIESGKKVVVFASTTLSVILARAGKDFSYLDKLGIPWIDKGGNLNISTINALEKISDLLKDC